MDYLRRFQRSMNDEEGLAAQESWDERPWRWVPDVVRYPAATIGGIYRNLTRKENKSLQGKKDPTLNKEMSLLKGRKQTMPKSRGTKTKGKLRRRIKLEKKKLAMEQKLLRMPGLPPRKPRLGFRTRPGKQGKIQMKALAPMVRRQLITEQQPNRRAGSTYSFASRGAETLVMSGRQRLGQIVVGTSTVRGGGTVNALAINFDTALGTDTVIPLNPSMLLYFSNPLSNIIVPFNKFLWEQFEISYVTQIGTNNSGKVMFAYTSDIDYLEGLGYTGINAFISEGDLARFSNCKTYPMYEDFTYSVPVLKGKTPGNFYMRNEYTLSNARYSFDNAGDTAEDRQCFQGLIMLTGATGGGSFGFIYGDVYINYRIVLTEMSQNARVAVTPSVLREKKLFDKFYARFLKEYKEREQDEHEPGRYDRKDTEGKNCKQQEVQVTIATVSEEEASVLPGFQALELARKVSSGSGDYESVDIVQ